MPKSDKVKKTQRELRDERLAANLRANLRRRKQVSTIKPKKSAD